MKKHTTVLVLFWLVGAVLIFAGGQKEGTTTAPAEEVQIEVTSDFAGNPKASMVLGVMIGADDTVQSTYDSRREYAEKSIRAWAEKHPDVKVEYEIRPSGNISQTMSKLLTSVAAGAGPEFAQIDSFWTPSFLAKDLLQPIEQYMPAGEQEQFFDFTRPNTFKDGIQYAIWGETDARALYYRSDLIDTPPATWDELIETAVKVSNEKGIYGFLTPLTGEAISGLNTWVFLWAQGGRIMDPDQEWRPVLGEGENRERLIGIYNFYRRMIDSGASPELITGLKLSNVIADVKAGNVAMMIHGSWAYTQIQEVVEDPSQTWDIAPYPQKVKGQRANHNGGWCWGILTKDKAKQEVAFSYIWDIVASREAMAQRARAHNNLPTRKDVYQTDSYFNSNPVLQFFYNELATGHARPATPLYPMISQLNQEAVGKVLVQGMDPAAAVDELQKKALEVWEDFKKGN
jgi:multiple sugar transport system substrate-binding protein